MLDPLTPTVCGTFIGCIWAEFPEPEAAAAVVTAVFTAPVAWVTVAAEFDDSVVAPLNWTRLPPILKTVSQYKMGKKLEPQIQLHFIYN